MNDAPVYIVGLSGTGKTALRRILGRHPRLSLSRKTAMWARFDGRFGDLATEGALDCCLDRMLADPAVRRLDPDRERIRAEFGEGPPTYANLFAVFHRQHAARVGKARWGEQFGPGDQCADRILGAFPSGRIVHLLRDAPIKGPRPRRRTSWVMDRDIVDRRRSVRSAERNRARHGEERYLILRTASLVANPGGTIADICGFIGEQCPSELVRAAGEIAWTSVSGSGGGAALLATTRGDAGRSAGSAGGA